jgi:transposase-like protein
VQLLVRLRTTRVFYRDPAPRRPGQMGAPVRHGAEFSCSDPARRHAPDVERTAQSGLYGTVTVRAWTGLHQKLGSTGRWASWPRDTPLPIVRGTVLQVAVGHLPDGRKPPKDRWLWHAGPVPAGPDLLWKAYLRRFGQEHFHRFAKSYPGLASAHLNPAAATGRWVALAMGAYAQPRRARHLADDLRRPWHPRPDPDKPLEVPRGFRTVHRLGWTSGKVKELPRPKKSFSPEFKDEAVKMVIETSRPIARVAKELGINEGTLGNWVSVYRREHAGEEPPLAVNERVRLRELERETRELKMENDFLKKAAAYFAKDHR